MSDKTDPLAQDVFAMPDFPVAETGMSETGPDAGLLARSRTAWELGDWTVLAALADQPLEEARDRAKLALMAAVGLAQLGQLDTARIWAERARGWGCPASLMARVLIGGVLNSLGRVASLLEDDILARKYFESSVRTVSPRADATILGRARNISEKAGLGLLPQAVQTLKQELYTIRETPSDHGGGVDALACDIKVLQAEVRAARAVALSGVASLPGGGKWCPPRAEIQPPFIVAAAGVPRSGSTWVYNAVRLLCEQAGLSCYAEWCEEYAPGPHADCDIHLVKLHRFEDLTFTPHRILTTQRNLVDRLASILRMGWLQDDPQKIRRAAEAQAILDSHWALRTNCETRYEDILQRPQRALLEIAHVLEISCTAPIADVIVKQLDGMSPPKSVDNKYGHDQLTLLHPNHRATDSKRRKYQSIIREALAENAE